MILLHMSNKVITKTKFSTNNNYLLLNPLFLLYHLSKQYCVDYTGEINNPYQLCSHKVHKNLMSLGMDKTAVAPALLSSQ